MELNGSEISFRPIELNDTDLLLKWRNSPSVKRNFIYQKDLTKEEHLNWLENIVKPGRAVQFIIEGSGPDHLSPVPLGSVFLRDIDMTHRKAECGMFIGEEGMRSKGVGTKTLKFIFKYGFEQLNLNRIFARVLAENLSSLKMCQKAGFRQEGIFKQDVYVNGAFTDVIYVGVLRKDFYSANIKR